MEDERSPLLQFPGSGPSSAQQSTLLGDHHSQFCHIIGTRPIHLPPDQKHRPPPESLYRRAVHQKDSQNRTYIFTAALTNTLILSQVVLGAALTGLGASDSSHILITVFGALNTIIAGLIAWLKSRGQPMRARMFRDDLERVVDEIENSAMMWLGISKGVHGYDKIDTDDQVTVRSEVARLTRLYDRAVKTNTLNDPDMYSTGAPTDLHNAALRTATGQPALPALPAPPAVPAVATMPVSGPPPGDAAVAVPAAQDPDASPATKAPDPEPAQPDEGADDADNSTAHPKDGEASSDGRPPAPEGAEGERSSGGSASKVSDTPTPGPSDSRASAPTPSRSVTDPDESPATAAVLKKHTEDTSASEGQK